MGLIGGGPGAFIGRVHHMAAILDGQIELVCGAFSSNPEISKSAGDSYGIATYRSYGSYQEMFDQEMRIPAEERMQFVSIVTPNHLHFDPARMAIERGFHVVCDKPLSFSLEEAKQLSKMVKKSGLQFAVTHTYNGYPMVKEARHRVLTGEFGKIRKVIVEYTQGWLSQKVEDQGQKQASWRMDPSKAGISCTMGDIGVHAFNLAEYITGQKITHLCADVAPLVEGRMLDDDGGILVRFENGARGVISASQICAGEENSVRIQVYGETGGLEWQQMEPNTLILKWNNQPKQLLRTGTAFVSPAASANTRLPSGHPEGFIEAFASIYRNFALRVLQPNSNMALYDFPDIEAGVRGMLFIYKAVESGKSNEKWLLLE